MDQRREKRQNNQRENSHERTKKLTLAAMFFALGIVLPFWIGQIPAIGKVLLPMHIPVLLCGLIVGWKYGLAVGFLLPVVRGMLFGMPKLFPNGMAMALELGTYGLVIGLVYGHSKWKCMLALYRSLITAMIAGRLVWAAAEVVLLGVTGSAFTWQMFVAGAFLNAIPGIILQLVLIPTVMAALNRANVLKFSRPDALRENAQ
ncbi:ECF transporter S component [Brotaphodocola sp.]|uniref:ECF transporter S component n=1 Tax=Brotaphodocola sp. TaxID=3073577 RepID=UPI003D7EBA66